MEPGAFTVFIVFLILKLTGVIAWSWWWVTCPLWIEAALAVAFWLVFLIFGGSVAALVGLVSRSKRKRLRHH